MAWLGNYAYNALFGGVPVDGRYEPSVKDVLTIKTVLRKKSTLPYELIDVIMDFAEYWPHTTTRTSQSTTVTTGRREDESKFILRSFPLGYVPQTGSEQNKAGDYIIKDPDIYPVEKPKPWPESREFLEESTQEVLSNWLSRSFTQSQNPCRKIIFTVKSHDQGWATRGKRGTYEGSYTWFEAGLEKFATCLQAAPVDAETANNIPCPNFELEHNSDLLSNESSQALVGCLRTVIPASAAKQGQDSTDTFLHNEFAPSMELTIQRNVVASREFKEHQVIWKYNDCVTPDSLDAAELDKQGRGKNSANGDFVKNMAVGDTVTIWAHSRFDRWANYVQEATIDVYWAV